MKRTLLMTVLALAALPLALFAGAQGEGAASGEPQHLKMYLVFDPAPDSPQVIEAFNKLTLRDLNAQVEIEHLGGDYKTRYQLLMTSGEQADLVFTAKWAMYDEMASQGAFAELDELVPELAPLTWKEISREVWNHTRRGPARRIYMVPKNDVYYGKHGVLYRLDWAKELGFGKIDSTDELYQFMKAVKREKGIIPISGGQGSGMFEPLVQLSVARGGSLISGFGGLLGGLQHFEHTSPRRVLSFWENEPVLNAMRYLRQAYQDGLIPTDVLSLKMHSRGLYEAGNAAVFGQNALYCGDMWKKMLGDGTAKEMDWFFADWSNPVDAMNTPAVAGMAVPISAKYPKTAVRLIEKLHQDTEYNGLLTYGIRGKHYDLDSQGRLVALPGGDGFPADKQNPWGFREHKFHYSHPMKDPQIPQGIRDAWAKMETYKGYDISAGFGFDKTKVSAEYAASENARKQYFEPLQWGVVDVEKGIADLRQKLKQAGYDKVQAELLSQWKTYLDQNGY